MQYLTLIYIDQDKIDALPEGEFDRLMHGCITHADELRADGKLLDSQKLEAPATARSLRVRGGKSSIVDGPFAETKEVLGGYNLIEAADMDEAMRIAAGFPWASFGCIEVRPVTDFEEERRRVGA